MCCTKLSCLLLVEVQKSSRTMMSFSSSSAVLADEQQALLLAEGRIGEHHLEALARIGGQRVATCTGTLSSPPMPCR